MPDLDPESIPTLDDVIEPVAIVPEVIDSETSDNEVKSIVVESEPVLFTAEPVVDLTDEPDIEDVELESDTVLDTSFNFVEEDEEIELNHINTSPDITGEEDSDNFESALVDYNTKDSVPDSNTESLTDEFKPDAQSEAVQAPTLISDNELQSISDEIVLQLMPELEQRLRVLVQQVLKEKLPPGNHPV